MVPASGQSTHVHRTLSGSNSPSHMPTQAVTNPLKLVGPRRRPTDCGRVRIRCTTCSNARCTLAFTVVAMMMMMNYSLFKEKLMARSPKISTPFRQYSLGTYAHRSSGSSASAANPLFVPPSLVRFFRNLLCVISVIGSLLFLTCSSSS